DLAVADARPERVRFLTEVVRAAEPEPEYVETLLLVRLAGLGLPPALLSAALEAVRDGGRAAGEPEAYPRLTGEGAGAARARHEALVLLLARGYAPRNDAGRALGGVKQQQATLLALQRSVREALAARDDARALLPWALAAAARRGDEAAWLPVAE